MLNHCKYNNKKQSKKVAVFPAKVFGYIGLCQNLSRNINAVIKGSNPVFSHLPFVSSLTNRVSPEGMVHMHWAFLKY